MIIQFLLAEGRRFKWSWLGFFGAGARRAKHLCPFLALYLSVIAGFETKSNREKTNTGAIVLGRVKACQWPKYWSSRVCTVTKQLGELYAN